MAYFEEHDTQDAPAAANTPYRMAAGDTFEGALTDRLDEDWVRVELNAGHTYHVRLGGFEADAGLDTVLRLFDADGERLAVNDDANLTAGQVNSRLTFSPDADGMYFISAGAYRGNSNLEIAGRYRLTLLDEAAIADLSVTGTDGAETLHGGAGADTLDGGAGADWLAGGPGADVLSGGAGQDTAGYRDSEAGVTVRLDDGAARGGHAEGDTFARPTEPAQALPDIENLFGSAHADVLVGNRAANTLRGHYGNDTLDGQGGNDWLVGGPGADALSGGTGFDTVSYADSDAGVTVYLYNGAARGGHAEGDTFPGRKTIAYTDEDGVTQTMMVSDIEYLDGSEHNDALAGDRGNDRLEGRGGNDRLDGREGDDRLEGEAGADILTGGPGEDTASYRYSDTGVVVRLHSGTARGGHAEGDTFTSVRVRFIDADGAVLALQLPDVEHLVGSVHGDVLAGDGRDNRLDGGPGHDTLYGGPVGGDDTLLGGAGDDRLFGGKGGDTLTGGPGDDWLRGGPGNDSLNGGEGADTFFLAPGGGDDTVLDFGRGQDRIDLSVFETARSPDDLVLQQQADGLVIDLAAHGGGSLTLAGVTREDLADTDFIFFTDDAPVIA